MVMPANNLSGIVHYFAGKYPGSIGMLNSPFSWKRPPFYIPYAIDNGAYTRWEPESFKRILGMATFIHKPLWVLVPDAVGDRDTTLRLWDEWSPYIRGGGFRLAFACQDGMTEKDVPPDAHCAFIGGSTKWKLDNAHRFKGSAPILHIGRVNTENRLRWAVEIGADSVDGTGFFRGSQGELKAFIEHFTGKAQVEFDYRKTV